MITKWLTPKLGQHHQYAPVPLSHRPFLTVLGEDCPSISIVTPSYNQAEFLERTLLSILNQKYPKLEYVVQDGASCDGSLDVIKRYSSSLSHWESREDNGQSQAINLGFSRTTGEIMAWINSDDLLLPGALNYVADYFMRHPDVDVIYSHRLIVDENDCEVGRWLLPPHKPGILKWVDYIPQETLFWRRTIWEKVGGKLDENFDFAMDWDLLLRFEHSGAVIHRVPEFLGAFRVHSQQKSSAISDTIGLKEKSQIRLRLHNRKVSRLKIVREIWGYLLYHVLLDVKFRITRYLHQE